MIALIVFFSLLQCKYRMWSDILKFTKSFSLLRQPLCSKEGLDSRQLWRKLRLRMQYLFWRGLFSRCYRDIFLVQQILLILSLTGEIICDGNNMSLVQLQANYRDCLFHQHIANCALVQHTGSYFNYLRPYFQLRRVWFSRLLCYRS